MQRSMPFFQVSRKEELNWNKGCLNFLTENIPESSRLSSFERVHSVINHPVKTVIQKLGTEEKGPIYS